MAPLQHSEGKSNEYTLALYVPWMLRGKVQNKSTNVNQTVTVCLAAP